MAVSDAVKVGHIDLGQVGAVSGNCSNRIGFSVDLKDKAAYIQQIARISVGEFEPQADICSKNEGAEQK